MLSLHMLEKERQKPIPAVHLILVQNNKVFLLRRFQTGWQDGNYSVPAGHVDIGESVLSAIIREAQEEIGIILDGKNLQFCGVLHRQKEDGEARIDFFFTASEWGGEIVNNEPEKCDQLDWFPLDELPSNIVPYVLKAIENFNRNILFSNFGWD